MSQLHELLAVEPDLKTSAEQMVGDALNTFTKKPDHFKGQVKTVVYFDAAREGENTSDEKALVTTVDDKLTYALGFLGKYYDGLLQKEATNQVAKADLVVDGTVLATGLPSTFLLGLEARLKSLRDVLIAIPTLEPSITWTEDAAAGVNVWRASPVAQMKSEKVFTTKVMYEATKEHPAQIKELMEDKPVARMETLSTSGMWTPARKAATIERLDKLLRATKRARQRANMADVVERTVSKELFAFVLNG